MPDTLISAAPLLRGLSRGTTGNGRYGLHVRYLEAASVTAPEGACVVGAELLESRDADAIRAAFDAFRAKADAAGSAAAASLPGAVFVPGRGVYGLGRDLDSAASNAMLAASGSSLPAFAGDFPAEGIPLHLERSRVVDGAVVAVTGGAQGFGEEIVRGLAAAGATVFIVDLNEAGAAKLAAELNSAAGRKVAVAVVANVTDEASVAAMAERFVTEAGGIDLYVSNAGVVRSGSVKELGLGDFEFVTKVNYTGYFLGVKHVSPVMALQHCADPDYRTDIIQINSKSGLEGSNKNGAYAGGKFGGIGLTESFALELVTDGIKVNSVCPGNFLDGPLWSDPEKGLFVQYLRAGKVPGAKNVADVRAFYEDKVPMKRGCSGADVMKAIYYIMDQLYETGQAVPVTGGQVMLR
jgi:sorbitol-6-phosphate 2-dehydrogenase